jgi:hypothetical protein
MEDITPLNLDDHPKLFGLRYDQLIACLGSLIISTQIYSWLEPVMMFGQDLRLDFSVFLGLLGPLYCLVTLNNSVGHWEMIMNYYFTSQIFIPGSDPNPVRFLVDEKLPEFVE